MSGKLKFKLSAPIFYDSNQGKRTSPLQRVAGPGSRFIAVRVTGVSYYKVFGKDEKLVDLNLITSFGVKQLQLKSGDAVTVEVGPESIKLSNLSFDGESEVVVGVESKPEVKQAAAVVVRYDTDKPAKAAPKPVILEEPKKTEPKFRTLESPDKDIVVMSDRDEKWTEFFQRQRLVVGELEAKQLTALFEAKVNTEKLFLNYTSYNHALNGTGPQSTYGANVKLAPLSAPVAEALKDKKVRASILRRGAAESNNIAVDEKALVWEVVGYTLRSPVQFFEAGNKKGEFAPAALWYDKKLDK